MLLAPVVALGATVGLATAAQAVTNAPGYTHLQNLASGMCVFVPDASSESSVEQTQCVNTSTQEWQRTSVTFNGRTYTMFRNHFSNLCMAIGSLSPQAGSLVIQLPCNTTSPMQLWNNSDIHILHSASGNLCLDVLNGEAVSGLWMMVQTCDNSLRQAFDLV